MSRKNKRPFTSAVLMLLLAVAAIGLGIFTAKLLTAPLLNAGQEQSVPMDEIVDDKVFALIAGLDKAESNTDVLMVVCYNKKTEHIRVMSVPRDTYVYFGERRALINSAYSMSIQQADGSYKQGGIELTALKVKEVLGIPAINYYAIFKVGTFASLIDELGGVDFYVPQDMHYEDPYQDLYIHLNQGQQMLNGQMAENMVRFRSYPLGDLQRVEVQQKLLEALFAQKMNKSNIGKIDEVYEVLQEKVASNLAVKDLVKYASAALSVSMENVQMCTMPTKFANDAHLVPDNEGIQSLVPVFFEFENAEAQ